MSKRILIVIFLLAAMASPSFAVSKEIVQLQEQVSLLMSEMHDLQQSLDSDMAVLRTLVGQNTDTVNKLNTALTNLQNQLNGQAGASNQTQTQLSQNFQTLNDSLDQLRTQMRQMNSLLQQIQQAQTNIQPPTAPAPAPGQSLGGGQGLNAPQQQPAAAVLPAKQLYDNALSDYISGKYALAQQEFQQYLQAYPQDIHAADAAYYMGDIYVRQQDYSKAVEMFNTVLNNYPGHRLTPSAQLKKGYALIAMGKSSAGAAELRNLIQHYPHSQEARHARAQLQSMGLRP